MIMAAPTALADEPERRPRAPIDDRIALRVYEICVSRGYVDEHDWAEVEKQFANQVRASSMKPRAA
jgi:hypothetical protein